MNILVLTNIYPAPDLEKENTPIVHYFTREWVKMGFGVRVVHYPANFPTVLMKISSLFKKQLSSRLGATIRTAPARESEYELEGVKVKRIPLTKYKLHSRYPRKQIENAYKKTVDYLEKDVYKPDVIISHWVNPQLEIMDRLKGKYGVPTCYVAHIPYLEFTRMYKDPYSQQLINNIDMIGFRSAFIKEAFLSKFSFTGPTFQCYSGIPENLIPQDKVARRFEKLSSFIFVGTLIKRKYPAAIVEALSRAYPERDFSISYVGRGAESASIANKAMKYGVESSVRLLGYMDRNSVVNELRKRDVFVMISKGEAFGLVYLEAMAQGCITIASRHEGFDGIIQHGVNGFLCEAGNANELANLILSIKQMSPEVLKKISDNAVETAKKLTDKKAALLYINNIEKLLGQKEGLQK